MTKTKKRHYEITNHTIVLFDVSSVFKYMAFSFYMYGIYTNTYTTVQKCRLCKYF